MLYVSCRLMIRPRISQIHPGGMSRDKMITKSDLMTWIVFDGATPRERVMIRRPWRSLGGAFFAILQNGHVCLISSWAETVEMAQPGSL